MSSIDQGDKVTDTDTSASEIAELRRDFKEFQAAVQAWRDADTPSEKKAARDDVDEAEVDLEATAKRLGISKDALAKATAEAKRTEQKEALRPILAELLEEMVGDDEDESDAPEKDAAATPPEPEPVKDEKPKREPKPKPEPDEDTPPAQEHWIDKRIRF